MYSNVVFAFLLAVVVCSGIGGWLVVRHDSRQLASVFGAFMLLMAFWSATNVGTLTASTLPELLRFTQLSYVAVVLAPVVWLVFALRYRDRGDLLTRGRIALLLVVPVATLVVVFTAEHHTLLYASMAVQLVAGEELLVTTSGVWHSVNVVYSYALLLVGTGLLARSALTDNRLYRRQSVLLLACVLFPWAVNGAYHVGLRPVPWVDPTPLAFAIVGVPLAAVVVRTDLASFLPVAHERVFRTLQDPILVVTPAQRVVDSNRAARAVLGDGDPIDGAEVGDVLPDGVLDGGDLRAGLEAGVECTVDDEGEARHYLARRREIEPGPDGPSRGSLVTLTDITVQKDQQRSLERKTRRLEDQTARLERKNEQLERLADVVSHDMQAPLSTAEKLLALLEADLVDPDPAVRQSIDDLAGVHARLRSFADHIPRLARESTDVETTQACDIDRLAEAAWTVLDTGDVTLEIADNRTLQADHRRLQQVFENLFRNALEHGGGRSRGHATDGGVEETRRGDRESAAGRERAGVTTVRVGLTDRGFYVADDGPGIPPALRADVFEYGVSSGDNPGFGLAIVRTIVEAHGWEIDAGASDAGGARFEVVTES